MENSSLQIIELTGSPCSGKSTFLRAVQREPGVCILDYEYVLTRIGLGRRFSWFRNMVYEVFMFRTGIIEMKGSLLRTFFRQTLHLDQTLLRRMNAFRNIVHKFAMKRLVRNENRFQFMVVDEGISHIPYLFAGSLDRLLGLESYFSGVEGIWVIKLCAESEELGRRMQMRGHKRIAKGNGLSIMSFVKMNDEVSNFQDKFLGRWSKVAWCKFTGREDAQRDFRKFVGMNEESGRGDVSATASQND